MINKPAALLLAAGALLLGAESSTAAINLVGVTVPWRADTARSADTIGGNENWNAYIRSDGGFINSGDEAALRINESLEIGDYSYEIVVNHESWVDDAVEAGSRGVYLNLFFDGLSNPGISARLTGGNFGALAPLTVGDQALVPNDLDGSLVPPAGTLTYQGGGLLVTLTAMSFSVGPDEVDAYDEFPTGANEDSYVRIDLSVAIPEPATGLMGLMGVLLLARRRRR